MVFVSDRCAKQREDPITSGLGDITLIVMNGVDHQLKRRLDDGTRFLGIEAFDQLHRPLDVGEKHRDGLALAFKVFRGERASYSNLGLVGLPHSRRRCSQGHAALAAELFPRLDSSAASGTLSRKRRTALGTEFPP